MNALTLACLLSTATSMKLMVDLSHETDTHHANGTEKYVDPCPSSCGPDICADLRSPCDDFLVADDAFDFNAADMDWDAYTAAWVPYNDCWANNPNANPFDACYTTGEYGACLKAEKPAMMACFESAYGPMPTGDDMSAPPTDDTSAPTTDDMPAPPTDDMPAPPMDDMPAPDTLPPTVDPCEGSDDVDACHGAAMDALIGNTNMPN